MWIYLARLKWFLFCNQSSESEKFCCCYFRHFIQKSAVSQTASASSYCQRRETVSSCFKRVLSLILAFDQLINVNVSTRSPVRAKSPSGSWSRACWTPGRDGWWCCSSDCSQVSQEGRRTEESRVKHMFIVLYHSHAAVTGSFLFT